MAGIDDNVAIIGEWMPPSPSPRTFFSSILGDSCGSRPISELSNCSRTEELLLGHREQIVSGNNNVKDVSQGYNSGNQATCLGSFSEQKSNSRSGLGERIAARAGFNAPRLNTESIKSPDLSFTSDVRSSYLTIPPGLSPTTLLDSPVFLSNSLAQPSPTTGKFSFILNGSNRSSAFMLEATDQSKDNFYEDIGASSFAFKPNVESGSSFFSGAMSKMTSATFSHQSFPTTDVSVQSGNTPQNLRPTKFQSQNPNTLQLQQDFSNSSVGKDRWDNDNLVNQKTLDKIGPSMEHSPPVDEKTDKGDQRGIEDSLAGGCGGTTSEDGYNWRKYGQKQVKGSEYPRSYYKCTHPNCSVTKKVERSHEGHITEIIYKGAHNHPKPPPNRRSGIGSSNPMIDRLLDTTSKQAGTQAGTDNDPFWASTHKGSVVVAPDWRHDNLEVTSSVPVGPEYCNRSASLQGQNGTHVESGDIVDASSTLSNDEEDDDQGTHGSVSLGYDGEGDESESKRRRIEEYAKEMTGASRAIREPRVVVQTTSEVDILDDGYRWRKYGQKVVKGNPNPRSYYKCTNPGCTVRKHVERASHDLKSVITTYEGKHNHDVPATRNNSHVNSGASSNIIGCGAQASSASVQANIHRPEPYQMHNGVGRFETLASFGSFGLPGRNQMGPSLSLSYGMNQPGLANLGMTGLGPGQQKYPVLSAHPYLAQQRQLNSMGFMLPKEPKVEPISETGLNLSNGSVYQQFMSGPPLGPQM